MLQISPFVDNQINQAVELSRKAGWPHRFEDWALVTGISQGVVALKGDRVVGTAFCTGFGSFATANMIIVDPAQRGHGLGRQLMTEAMERTPVEGFSLIATELGRPLYTKLGFVSDEYIDQHQGILCSVPMISGEHAVMHGGSRDIETIIAMDRVATGMDRANLLRQIIDTGSLFLGDGGYALRRRFGKGKVIGPVIAANAEWALALIVASAQGCEGCFLRMDAPASQGLGPALENMGLPRVESGLRMLYGTRPVHGVDYKIFALASQALG